LEKNKRKKEGRREKEAKSPSNLDYNRFLYRSSFVFHSSSFDKTIISSLQHIPKRKRIYNIPLDWEQRVMRGEK